MSLKGFLFDVDGTLIDANRLHARAFVKAFHEAGYTDIVEDRVLLEIGKGGDRLVPTLLGDDISEDHMEKLIERKEAFFAEAAEHEKIPVFPKVRELIDTLRDRGFQTAIATAANPDNLKAVKESCGLDVPELADEMVSNSDVKESKPDPATVEAAVEKLGLKPEECVMVGDTVYDGEMSRRAGVKFIGLLTGPWTAADLERAGAVATYRDTGDLLEHLDEAVEKASR